MKKVLILCGIVIIVAAVVASLYKPLTTSKIVVVTNPLTNESLTRVQVDGTEVEPTEDGSYESVVGRGNHSVTFSTPGFEKVEQSVETGFRSTKKVDLDLKAKSAQDETAALVKRDSLDYSASSARYYGRSDWLAFNITLPDGTTGIGIARYDVGQSDWRMVSEGSVVFLGEDAFDAPGELLKEFQGQLYELDAD
jgi:hypothetical protein